MIVILGIVSEICTSFCLLGKFSFSEKKCISMARYLLIMGQYKG